MRHGSKKRRIGLDQHAVERDLLGRGADVLSFRKADVTGERDIETHIEGSLCVFPLAGKTMEDPAQAAGSPVVVEHLNGVLPGVLAVVGRTAMDHNSQSRTAGLLHLPP